MLTREKMENGFCMMGIRPHFIGILSLVLGSIFLSGCMVGPDFLRPITKANHPSTGFINDIARGDQTAQSMSRWWERINDPLLNIYVAQLLDDNLQLAQAAERVVQANARTRVAGGALYPSLSTEASGTRSFTGNAGGGFGGGSVCTPGP